MFDTKVIEKVKLPEKRRDKLSKLTTLLRELFGYFVSDLVEYEILEDGNIVLTFFDGEDFVQEEYPENGKKYKQLIKLLYSAFKKKTGFRFMNIVNFNKIVKEADGNLPGIDYIRLSLSGPLEYFQEYLNNLDYENSNFAIDDKNYLTLTKIRLLHGPGLICSVAYKGVSIPIILYNEFDDKNQRILKSFGKIDLYGSYFRLVEIGFLEEDFLEKIVKSKEIDDLDILKSSNITRLDYKIDLFYKEKVEIPHYKDLLKIRKNSKVRLKNDPNKRGRKKKEKENKSKNKNKGEEEIREEILRGDKLQSWAYGSKSAKRVFLRVYDKLADTEAKGKYVLYPDYFNYKSVYRIEFELLNHFCKGYKYSEYNELVNKFWDSIQYRYIGKMFYTYNDKPNFEEVEERVRYFKDFIGRGERILENGFNPFLILYKGLEGNLKLREDKLVDLVFELYSYVGEGNGQTNDK